MPVGKTRLALAGTWGLLVAGSLLGSALMLPLWPVNSALWKLTSSVHDNFAEQIGWEELAQTVADIYRNLPTDQQHRIAILTGNYGEAGAINLYGPALDLPTAISGINSYWLRGYGSRRPRH